MHVTVKRSVHLAADAASVWQRVGGFDQLHAWHPAIASCVPEGTGDAIERTLTTVDGAVVRERRIALSNADMTYSYTILESPLPVADYRSTLSVSPAGSGCVVVWTSTFQARGVSDADAADLMGGIYQAGLDALT